MRFLASILGAVIITAPASWAGEEAFSLSRAVAYALRHNPEIVKAQKDVDVEAAGVRAAEALKMPRIDFAGSVTRYRYPSPITPISGSPLAGAGFPEFDNLIADAGLSFTVPLYRGGRLDREVAIADMRKTVANELFRLSRQEIAYNVTAVYFKMLQLQRLLQSSEETVRQLEAHLADVEANLRAGTVPRVDLLKAGAELASAGQNALIVRNNLESTREFFRILLGIEDVDRRIVLTDEEPAVLITAQDIENGDERDIQEALKQRPDYQAAIRKSALAVERSLLVSGRRLPSINLTGEYAERTGERPDFRENWNMSLRITLPLFDGGLIKAEEGRERALAEKAREEERALRIAIGRDVRDARRVIKTAAERITVAEKEGEAAREALRIERIRYGAGAGTNTDFIDAQAAALRAEAGRFQALYDLAVAKAALRKARGEDVSIQEVSE